MDITKSGIHAADPPFEFFYHIAASNAFRTLNAAVFSTLSRYAPGQAIERDEIDGATVYLIGAPGVMAQLFVTYISEKVASISLRWVVPSHSAEYARWQQHRPNQSSFDLLEALFQQCHEEAVRRLRYAASVDVQPVPHPPKDDLQSVFTWQAIYYPDMTNQELAELIGVDHQTIRNARSRLGMGKRTQPGQLERIPRGKAKKS